MFNIVPVVSNRVSILRHWAGSAFAGFVEEETARGRRKRQEQGLVKYYALVRMGRVILVTLFTGETVYKVKDCG